MKKNQSLELTVSLKLMKELAGKKNLKKLKELFPEAFETEADKALQPFAVEVDDASAMITIANTLSPGERSAEKCYMLNQDYVWKLIKRYDASGVYQSYLVPVHRSVYKIRRKRKNVKVAE
jgi:adenosine deaminase